MEFKQLEAFVAVVENKSFSEAARQLNLTQPTISAHIQSLEQELNSRLLIRTTKKKWLFGQFVYVTLVTILYTVLMLLFTSVLCMKDSYPGNLWSDTAALIRQYRFK